MDAGPIPVSEGALIGYAPDGETLWSLPGPVGDDPAYDSTKALAIDPTDGSSTDRAWPTGIVPTWQRTAIEP